MEIVLAFVVMLLFGWWLGTVFSLLILTIVSALIVLGMVSDRVIVIRRREDSSAYLDIDWFSFVPAIMFIAYTWSVALYVRSYWSFQPLEMAWQHIKPFVVR